MCPEICIRMFIVMSFIKNSDDHSQKNCYIYWTESNTTRHVMKVTGLYGSFSPTWQSEVIQSCPTLCDPMDCSLPGSSIHGIFQARTLEWVAISFSRRSSLTQGLNPGLPHCRQMLYHLSHQGSLTDITLSKKNLMCRILHCATLYKVQGYHLEVWLSKEKAGENYKYLLLVSRPGHRE